MNRFKIGRGSCWTIMGASVIALCVIICSGGGYTPLVQPTVELVVYWVWMGVLLSLIFIDRPQATKPLGLSDEGVQRVVLILVGVLVLCVGLLDGYGSALCVIVFYLGGMALTGRSFMKHVVR